MRRIYGFLCICSLSLANFVATAIVAVRSLVADAFPPGPMRFAIAAPMVPRSIEGQGFARSLLNSLRHEAGARRRAAARNT